MYDEAFKQHPDNEEAGAQAFLAMIKVRSWKPAQQVCKSLFVSTSFPDFRYLSGRLETLEDIQRGSISVLVPHQRHSASE